MIFLKVLEKNVQWRKSGLVCTDQDVTSQIFLIWMNEFVPAFPSSFYTSGLVERSLYLVLTPRWPRLSLQKILQKFKICFTKDQDAQHYKIA